jgi:outer membrane protein OmpA-like peptidoglycan-associated protein
MSSPTPMKPITIILILSALLLCDRSGAQDNASDVATVTPDRTAAASSAEALRFREMLVKYRPFPTDEFTMHKVNNTDRSALFEVYIDIPELNEVRATAVLFAAQSHEVDPTHFPWLDHFAHVLKQYPMAVVKIEAHTDSVGRAADNQALSELRAMEVRSQLVGRGIDTDRIHAVGLGERFPTHPNSNKEGRRLNRRVEFKTYFPVKRR